MKRRSIFTMIGAAIASPFLPHINQSEAAAAIDPRAVSFKKGTLFIKSIKPPQGYRAMVDIRRDENFVLDLRPEYFKPFGGLEPFPSRAPDWFLDAMHPQLTRPDEWEAALERDRLIKAKREAKGITSNG